ncbi:hypothetical protein ACIBL8_33375 [Streptomyces sp. NPDC050523]|uniref:hypothetical protein n=1 Tax=Streptomyces sp. NPDC050523 TaxID=3365622 RepID=UPI00379DDC90
MSTWRYKGAAVAVCTLVCLATATEASAEPVGTPTSSVAAPATTAADVPSVASSTVEARGEGTVRGCNHTKHDGLQLKFQNDKNPTFPIGPGACTTRKKIRWRELVYLIRVSPHGKRTRVVGTFGSNGVKKTMVLLGSKSRPKFKIFCGGLRCAP